MKYGELTLGQVEALVNKLEGMEVVKRILQDQIVISMHIRNFIIKTFKVLVDETQSVDDLLTSGDFHCPSHDVNSNNFPKPKKGMRLEKVIALFTFDHNKSVEEIIAAMDKEGYKPATVWDLLCLAMAKPYLEREGAIFALGSVCNQNQVVSLYHHNCPRVLRLSHYDYDWYTTYVFAAVLK